MNFSTDGADDNINRAKEPFETTKLGAENYTIWHKTVKYQDILLTNICGGTTIDFPCRHSLP